MLRGESANKGIEGEAGGEGAVGRRSNAKLLVLLIGVTAVAFIGLVWFVWGSYKRSVATESQHHRVIELHGVITHFDEVLTMSARMVAATGDLKWERRYRDFEPGLDRAIKEAMSLAPQDFMTQAAAQTDSANIKLVAMENEAFDLVRGGNREAASRLLHSREYEEQKRLYSGGMTQYAAALEEHIKAESDRRRIEITGAVTFVSVAMSLASFGWFAALKMREDIARRKRAEKKMVQVAAQWQATFDSITDCVSIQDSDFRIVRANRALADIFETEPQELIGRRCYELIHGLCEPHPNCPHKRTLETQKACTEDFFEPHLGIHLEVSTSPLFNDQGQLTGSVHIARDITSRKQSEAERERLLHDVQERMKELQCVYGVANSIRSRQNLEDIFRDVAELIPAGWHYPEITRARVCFDGIEYISEPFEKTQWKQRSDIVIKGEQRGCVEVYYIEQCPELDEGPFLAEERKLVDGIARTLSEAVERKVVEQQLRRVQAAVDNASDAIVITDKHGKAIYANTAFGNLFDCTVESINEADLNSIFADINIAIEAYRGALLGGSWTGRTQMVSANGRSFPVFLRCTPLMDNGSNISGTLLIVSDITELKAAEDRRAQLLKEVESANNELKDFAYIVSHDLKTPLRGISTLAHWISDDYADKLGADGKEQMELLLSRVVRMHDLIEGILQYSRVGRTREELVEVELGELVPEVIDNVAAPENISITIEDELPAIVCEHTRIMQVFQNLLSNAVKYMDKPAGQIRIGCVDEGDCWKFSVADNGPGIEVRHFERIFKVFQTVSGKDGYESTGVGLSVVKKIVEMYGGKIWVESEVGKGSSFFFTFAKPERRNKDAKLEANIAH